MMFAPAPFLLKDASVTKVMPFMAGRLPISIMARTLATALAMPLTERRMRWEAMMEKLNGGTIQQWFADFIEALQDTHNAGAAALPEPTSLWPRRAADFAARYH